MKITEWTDRGSPGRGALAAVAAAALALRLWHLGWGLPDLYEEATPLFRAWGFWNWSGGGLDLNPRFFNYPALSFHVQFLLQVVHFGVGLVVGAYPGAHAFQASWASDISRFVLIGRLPGVLCDVGTVVVTGLLAGRLVSRRAGLLAAVMAAVNPLQIRLSQMIAVDSMLAFFCSFAVLHLIELALSGGMKRALQAGLLVGLAASTKYNGAVLLVPLVLATVLGLRKGAPGSRGATAFAILSPVITACGIFFVLNPFILLDSSGFLRDFGFEQAHMAAGHFGVPAGDSTPLFYLFRTLPGAIGWPALALGIPGTIWAVRKGDRRWLVAAFGFGILLVLPMVWAMRAERYILPALPGMILLFVAGLEWLSTSALRQGNGAEDRRGSQGLTRWAAPAAVLIALASFVGPVIGAAQYHRSMVEPDTRAGAAAWIGRNLPPGSAIALTPAGVNVDSAYVQLPIPYLAVELDGIAAMYDARWYTDMDLLVGSDFDRARYLQEPERYSLFLRFFYDSLDTRWRTVWSADPGPTRQGPRIWLYAPPRELARTLYPADLMTRLGTVSSPRMLTVFAANLSSVLDARGRQDRARQLRTAAVGELLRRFPDEAHASISLLSSMAVHSGEVCSIADSISRVN